MRITSFVFPVLLFAVGVVAQGRPAAITPLPGSVNRCFARNRADLAYAGRIVDALTSRPIPGAVLYQVPERDRPTGGEFWFDAKWIADADGFVRVPASELRGGAWFVVDAKGYGPIAAMSYPPGDDGMTRLVPGIDFPVAVHDVLDRPVTGVEVGICLGCGHTPDVRTATTNARGIAVVPCMQSAPGVPGYHILDVYPRGEGLAPDYSERGWNLGEPPELVRQPFAAPVRGRVLAPNGRSLRGVAIRADCGLHRGPWAMTDAEGRFALLGNPTNRISLFLDEREFAAWLPSTQRAVDLVLPPGLDSVPRDGQWTRLPDSKAPASATGRVVVTVRDAVSGAPLQGARVELWRVGIRTQIEDWEKSGETDQRGTFSASIAAGDVALSVTSPSSRGDGAPPTHECDVRDVEVRAESELPVSVALTRRVPVTVRIAEGLRGVYLVTARGESHPIDALIADGKPVLVPANAPFAFRIDAERERGARYVSFDAPPAAPVELRPFAPTRVQLRIVDAESKPARAVVSLADPRDAAFDAGDPDPDAPALEPNTDARGDCTLTTELSGMALVTVRPLVPGHRTLRARVSLPEQADDARIDLGTLTLLATVAPHLRVSFADGSPAKGELTLLRPGLQVRGPLTADGGWDGIAPLAGDRVHVQFEELEREVDDAMPSSLLPLDAQLTGDGPWSLRQGGGTIVFDVQDDFGLRPDKGVIVFEDQLFWLSDRRELRGVPERDLEFFVGADGCDSARVRLALAPNEQRRIDVVLKRRQ